MARRRHRRNNPSRETTVVVAIVSGLAAFGVTALVMQGRRNFAIDACVRMGELIKEGGGT
jgi:hypothetical protein